MKSLDLAGHVPEKLHTKAGWVLIASYVSDWIVLVVFFVVGLLVGNLTPLKRPFSLEDPNISYVAGSPGPPVTPVPFSGP